MVQKLFDWLLQIPQVIANFGEWLVSPLDPTYMNISPLELLGIGGISVILGIIVVHIVKLFIG